ncbi:MULTISPECIES: hypothetical protein [unclassified Aureispira]|uniref:hypothetical protein n=1 Tax=unclassified Aureispira TaxID=2649989 RepID=UPI000696F188|nr:MULTISPECIES: hypothetical protein [unclassified Aureispira]WMX12670.1 hypothetical protein QP953_17705 [Aureispira sp. CCB-E]
MHKTKLVNLFQHLDSREITRFLDYVNSPFYNKHAEVKKLCAYLAKYVPNPKRQHRLEKERVFKYVYPNKKFDGNALHSISSKLLSLLHDYLVITAHEEKHNQHLIKILAELRHRKQFKDYDAILRKIERSEESSYTDVEDLYWEKFSYHKELDVNFVTQGGRTYNENLQLKNDFLDLFFITKKLKVACDMVSRNIVIGSNYEYRLVDELFVYLDQPNSPYGQEPTIKIYAGVLKMLLYGEKGDGEYFKVKGWLVEHQAIFSKKELKNIYDYLENYCIRCYNKTASEQYLKEILDISKFLVKHEINFVDGYLSDGDYKNIGTSAISLGDYEWAAEFIETYKKALIPQYQESAYSLLMGFLLYSKKEYGVALQALHNVVFTNYTYHIGAKMIQLKIYYEINEGEALYSLTDAFRNYLKRNKQLTEDIRVVYYNFINLIRRTYKLKESKDYLSDNKFLKEFQKLEILFNTTNPIASKTWLVEMFEALRNT